jgi:hypothetical protein
MDLAALRRWWPLAAVVALLWVTALAATRSTPQLDRIPPRVEPPLDLSTQQPTAAAPTPAGDNVAGEVSGGLPDWAATAALVALLAIAAAILIFVVVALIRDRLRRRARRVSGRRRLTTAPRTADDLVAALDAGLQDLSDADRDPRRAVIACWVRLEQAAAAAGTPRRPGDTPGDLVGRLLAEQQVDATTLAAFAAVYREARYATHTVDDQMRAAARAALQDLRADLAANVSRDAAGPPPSGLAPSGRASSGLAAAGVPRPSAEDRR